MEIHAESGGSNITLNRHKSSNPSIVSGEWKIFGSRVHRSQVVYFCQVFVLTVVIAVSLYNLSVRGEEKRELTEVWLVLLSSSLGYMLPNPSLSSSRIPSSLKFENGK